MKTFKLEKDLEKLYNAILDQESFINKIGNAVHPDNKVSACNLIRYLTIRSKDLRLVHDQLSEIGISSLRSSEGYVYRNITDALRIVKLMNGKKWKPLPVKSSTSYKKSKKILQRNANRIFNFKKKLRFTEIMVTLPTSAADDEKLVNSLIKNGMQLARINLSHDTEDVWKKMIRNVKNASKELDMPCKIYLDLAGPKIRTGKIRLTRKTKKGQKKKIDYIRVNQGDKLILSKEKNGFRKARRNKGGKVVHPPCIPISIPGIIDDVKIGDRVFIDDGKIGGRVIKKNQSHVELIIKQTAKENVKLRGEKGVNFPDTDLHLPSLTENDIANIPFVIKHADNVGYSFVRRPTDVRRLYEELDKHKRKNLGVILKIETKEAFENLPLILLEAMKKPKAGVMIARGDLAVEIGAESIAEVQDEILWICEAAHVPVIWATQVLDNLAKTGLPTRAEITDAAKSAGAECVMLNKGPHILEAVSMLSDILKRMEKHTSKKKSTLPPLHVALDNLKQLNV